MAYSLDCEPLQGRLAPVHVCVLGHQSDTEGKGWGRGEGLPTVRVERGRKEPGQEGAMWGGGLGSTEAVLSHRSSWLSGDGPARSLGVVSRDLQKLCRRVPRF